ncbi:MAG TPA: lipopolysaccharide biosynthesis protein [Sphingomonas sp.]|uniref:lipopolysaccharide biosynthesis protein n=1 Tax=Sphingomonas sp. TaxID=28214 RepID=UPI002ED90390
MNGAAGSEAAGPQRGRLLRRAFAMIEGGGIGRFLSVMAPTAVALGVQFIAFAVTARGLGVTAFGEYAAILGLAAIGVELVGLGGADLLVRAVSRDASRFAPFFGNMLLLIALTLVPVVLLGLYVAVFPAHSSLPPMLILMALAAEITIGRISASVELAMVAHSQPFRASCVRMTTAMARLALALAYFWFASSLAGWVEMVLVQSLVLAGLYLLVVTRLYGRPVMRLQTAELTSGVAFGVNQTARAMQGNIDRVILARFTDPAVLGAYAAGARMLLIGLFPLQVVTRILYPQFFRHGENGIAATRKFALKSLPAMLGTGILASVAVAGVGYFVPAVLGRDFIAARESAMLLGLSLPLIALQYLAADTLTGAGLQHIRAVIYGAAAVGFGLLLALGARVGGVNGLIAAYLVAHALLAGTLWVVAFTVKDTVRVEP